MLIQIGNFYFSHIYLHLYCLFNLDDSMYQFSFCIGSSNVTTLVSHAVSKQHHQLGFTGVAQNIDSEMKRVDQYGVSVHLCPIKFKISDWTEKVLVSFVHTSSNYTSLGSS